MGKLVSVQEVQAHGTGVCLPKDASENLLSLVSLLPNGVDKVSHVMPGLVETSCNLASVHSLDTSYQVLHRPNS